MNKILQAIIELLGNEFKVIKSFDVQAMDLDGVFAVNIINVENLHHGNKNDKKYTVSINAQTLTEQDKNKININKMYEHVTSINFNELKNKIENCVGVVVNDTSFSNDGESNNFSFNLDLYICVD